MKEVDFIDSPFSKIIANQSHIDKITNIASNRLNTMKNTPLSMGMKVELRTWKKFIQRKYIKSLTYERMNKFCNIPIEEARKNIWVMDNIENPNIPLNFNSKEGVRLDVGIFNEGRIRNRCVDYSNKDIEIVNKILKISRKLISKNFNPTINMDKRSNTYYMYFPPYIAKHYVKLGFSEQNKNYSNLKIPSYIFSNEEFQRIWWQGNLSEEASLYPFVSENKNRCYLYPRIQINRVKNTSINLDISKKETRLYHKDIPKKILIILKKEKHSLIEDESKILKNFNIDFSSSFSNIYINKRGLITAVYSLIIYKNLEKWFNIGFELKRQKKQFKLLLNNIGMHSKEDIRDIFIKYYKLFPSYLRGNKKIMQNKWLLKEDKKELLENDKATNSHIPRACRPRKNKYTRFY